MIGDRVKKFYDKNAQLYHQFFANPLIKKLERDEVEKVQALLDAEGKSVLDAGCGYGKFFSAWDKNGIKLAVGLDFSTSMLDLAKRKNEGVGYVLGDGFHLPFKDKSFDLSTCVGLSIYYKHFGSLLQEMARVTRNACVIGFSPRSLLSLAYKSSRILRMPSRRLERTQDVLREHFDNLSFQSCGLGLTLLCRGEVR